jgi:hypothetical protein
MVLKIDSCMVLWCEKTLKQYNIIHQMSKANKIILLYQPIQDSL